jgi:hypothetical protein
MCVDLGGRRIIKKKNFTASWIFSIGFRKKNRHTTNFMEIHPVAVKVFHADDELTVGHDKA